MKLIERLYMAYYNFSLYNKEYNYRMYTHPRIDSIFFLSIFTVFNISSTLKLFKTGPLFTTHLFDCFLSFLIIAGLLIFTFERNSKYKTIVEKHASPSESGKNIILGWVYAIATLVFFFAMNQEIFFKQ